MGKHFAKELLGFPCTVLANTPSLEDSRLLCGSGITNRRLDWPLRFQQWALRETRDQPQGFEARLLLGRAWPPGHVGKDAEHQFRDQLCVLSYVQVTGDKGGRMWRLLTMGRSSSDPQVPS